jgi:uncharacterized damage-inducible protein DinB
MGWRGGSVLETLKKMLAYKAWANELTFDAVGALPVGEDQLLRATRWESIAYTLSHVLVVDDIFRCHLSGKSHRYTFRNVEERLEIVTIRDRQREMDCWYREFASGLDEATLEQIVTFEFVGGGRGAMTRADIFMHVVNHGTYHRGLVSDMMCQIPADMPTNDLPVFLRDSWKSETAVAAREINGC